MSNDSVARAFVEARRRGAALMDYPGRRPADLDAAYAIQDRAIALSHRRIGGWKVGRIQPPLDQQFGADRLVGPIFADSIAVVSAAENEPAMPVFEDGFAAAEAEILCRLRPDWDGRLPSSMSEVNSVIDDIRLGIEVASSPYPLINEEGPAVTTSDFGNNAGLVIGTTIANWQGLDITTIVASASINGQTIGSAKVPGGPEGVLGAVLFLLKNLQARQIDGRGGLWVSTGAITGVHPVTTGDRFCASFQEHGEVCCRIVAKDGTEQ